MDSQTRIRLEVLLIGEALQDVVSIYVISWICKKQTSVAQSSTEAKYIAAAMASRKTVWL